jgi:hypothetical protein
MIFTAPDVSSIAVSLEHWEWAEYASCALVALACTGEFIAEFTNCWTGGIKERKDRLARRSTLLLITALALELVCLVETNSISGLLIGSLSEKASAADTKAQSAIEKSLLAENKASEAGTSADEAQHKADTVAKQAGGLTMRIEAASRKLGALEQDIRVQGPRWSLLAKAAPDLTKQLSAFTGQRVELFVCGRIGSVDGETLSTWGAIANMLEADGAKWKVEHGGLSFFDRCSGPSGSQPLGQGLMVFVNKHASTTTMEAAKTLGEGLAKALPPSPNKMPGIIDPDFSRRFSQPIEGKDTPWAMVANDPELITVLIGAHPQQ